MNTLPSSWGPEPGLKTKCKPVEAVDDDTRRLIDDMFRTMYAAPGVGLAAPQIGVTRRIIVVDVAGQAEKPQPIALVNPEVVWRSDETPVSEEGCRSLPGL